jgi:hypothetical protein
VIAGGRSPSGEGSRQKCEALFTYYRTLITFGLHPHASAIEHLQNPIMRDLRAHPALARQGLLLSLPQLVQATAGAATERSTGGLTSTMCAIKRYPIQ